MTTAPVGCLDGEQAIRDALAAGPTPGPWLVDQDPRPGMRWNRSISTEDGANWLCTMMHSGGKAPQMDEANADLIAACHPETMRSLLAELDHRRSANGQEGWQLVPVEPTPEMLLAGLQCAQQSESDLFITELMDIYTAMRRASPRGGGATGWISVEERLPPTTHHVLACNALGYVGRAAWDGRRWNHIGKPTHWQPLPAAPHQAQEAQGDSNDA